MKLEKDFFGFKTDLFICCVYDPPSNSSYSKELDHEILGHIEKEIEHFQKRGNVYCAVILTPELALRMISYIKIHVVIIFFPCLNNIILTNRFLKDTIKIKNWIQGVKIS